MKDYHIEKYNLNEMDIQIARRIREGRLEKKLSQAQLAKILNIDRTTITQIEIGRNKISYNNLGKISQILEKPLSYFVGDEEKFLKENKNRVILEDQTKEISDIIAKWKIKNYLEYIKVSRDFIQDLEQTLDYLCEFYHVDKNKIW